MSNVIKDKNDLLMLKDIINHFRCDGVSQEYLEDILKYLLPSWNGELLVKYKISDYSKNAGLFIPKIQTLVLSVDKMKEWVDKNAHELKDDFNITYIEDFKSYLALFVIIHEIEHVYQYLIGKGILDSENDLLKYGYKGLVDLLHSESTQIIPRPIKKLKDFISIILYKLKEDVYVLERNANVLSSDLLSLCALEMNRDDLYNAFIQMRNIFMTCGYTESAMGSFEETYRKLLLYPRFKRLYDKVEMSEKEKLIYGFRVKEDTRRLVLSGFKK